MLQQPQHGPLWPHRPIPGCCVQLHCKAEPPPLFWQLHTQHSTDLSQARVKYSSLALSASTAAVQLHFRAEPPQAYEQVLKHRTKPQPGEGAPTTIRCCNMRKQPWPVLHSCLVNQSAQQFLLQLPAPRPHSKKLQQVKEDTEAVLCQLHMLSHSATIDQTANLGQAITCTLSPKRTRYLVEVKA